MDIVKKIRLSQTYAEVNEAELSRRLGYNSQAAFASRMRTGKFTSAELAAIAEALGAKYECWFVFPDGTRL